MEDDELKRLLESSTAETRRHFEIVAEGLETKVELVAEAVAHFGEKLNREIDGLRDEMQRGFAETQSMIRFCYAV